MSRINDIIDLCSHSENSSDSDNDEDNNYDNTNIEGDGNEGIVEDDNNDGVEIIDLTNDDDDDNGGDRGGCAATTAWSTTQRSDKEGVGLQLTAPPRQRAAFLGCSIVRGKKSITPTINKL